MNIITYTRLIPACVSKRRPWEVKIVKQSVAGWLEDHLTSEFMVSNQRRRSASGTAKADYVVPINSECPGSTKGGRLYGLMTRRNCPRFTRRLRPALARRIVTTKEQPRKVASAPD